MELYHTAFQGFEGNCGSKLQMTVLLKLCQAEYLGDGSVNSNQIKFSRHLQSAISLSESRMNRYLQTMPPTHKPRNPGKTMLRNFKL